MNSLKKNRLVSKGLLGGLFIVLLLVLSSNSVFAAPKVNIWHDETDTAAFYKNIYVGISGNLGLKVTDTTITSATWSSSDSNIVQIEGDKDGAKLKALKEGAVTISVTAVTADGTFTESVISCAITRLSPTLDGYTNTSAQLLRGGRSDALSRGTVSTGFKVKIYGMCGDYYYIKVPDSYSFSDSILTRYVFILKSKITIPVTNVKLNKKAIAIPKGKSQIIKATLSPDMATNKQVKWTSSNTGVFSVSSGKIAGKKAGYGYIKAAAVEGKVSAYAAVTVYEPMTKMTAYAKRATNLRNGASTSSKYVSVSKKLKKNAGVTIYGKVGAFFYVKSGNTYGFVLKKDLVYMTISAPRVTLNKKSKKYPTVKVSVYNVGTAPKWSGTNKVVAFKFKKKSKVTKKYSGGVTRTTRTYYVIPKKEGRANTKVKVGKASLSYFISSYTRLPDTQGFIRVNTSKMYKAAHTGHPVRKTLKKNSKVIILAKCTKNWFYIKHGKEKGFVKASDVVYIKTSGDSISMYRYHNKTTSAYLINSKDDHKISFISSNKKIATVKNINAKNKKQGKIWAEKPGTIIITARYKYARVNKKDYYIYSKIKLKVKNIKVIMPKKKTATSSKTFTLKANVQTLPGAKLKWKTSNINVAEKKTKKNGKSCKFMAYDSKRVKITASYKDIKATCIVKVNPVRNVLIYQTEKRPKIDKYGNKAEDFSRNDKSKEDLDNMLLFVDGDFDRLPAEHYGNCKALCRMFSKGDLQDVTFKMFKKFYDGTGGETFTDSRLTSAAKNHDSTKKYTNMVGKEVGKVLNKKGYKGNISKMRYVHTIGAAGRDKYPLLKAMLYQLKYKDIGEPVFNDKQDKWSGLTLAVDSLWGNEIRVKSYTLKRNGTYNLTLTFNLYDHFGLDKSDVRKAGYMRDFRSWYLLQHYKDYSGKHKPFITVMKFDKTYKGKVK